jgi:parvulin-like peptidyl-prolyl isomerase
VLGFVGGFGLLPFDFNLKQAAAPEASAAPAASDSQAKPSSSAREQAREAARERRRKAMAAADGGADSAQIRASHLLVAYKDARRSKQTRSKEEAKARAEEALKRAKKGEDFAKVVAAYTDEPGGAERGGDLNKFGRGQMVPAFEQAAFALKPNEISGVVETDFGFHVIKRTE